MEFLRWLQEVRVPVLDWMFALITHLGEETLFMVIAMVFFWCIDKYRGYYLLFTGFIGTVCVQFLKMIFRIPRPWVLDPDFPIVESAREAATGYSFPSGHTQSSVGTFGSIFYSFKNTAVRIVSAAVCILVPLSRMYLGVHTPADVMVSIVIALFLIFTVHPIINKIYETKHGMYVLGAIFITISALFLVWVLCFPFPENMDPHNYESGVKNAYMMLGVSCAFPIVYFLDSKVTKFETSAPFAVQAVKFILGLILALALLEGLKLVFPSSGNLYGTFRALRYFLVFVIAGGIYPMSFAPMCKIYNKTFKRGKN